MPQLLPELLLHTVVDWRSWLAEHQHDEQGVRLVLAKKGAVAPTTLTYDEALLEALRYGWIDGQAGRRDEATFFIRFTPRRSRSLWSKRNVDYATRLIAEERMQPRGRAEVERAQADGRWAAAYSGPAGIEVPAELSDALAAEPQAQALWSQLNGQNRYAILHRIVTAVKPETRSRRVAQYVAMLARGETPYPQKSLGGPGQPESAP